MERGQGGSVRIRSFIYCCSSLLLPPPAILHLHLSPRPISPDSSRSLEGGVKTKNKPNPNPSYRSPLQPGSRQLHIIQTYTKEKKTTMRFGPTLLLSATAAAAAANCGDDDTRSIHSHATDALVQQQYVPLLKKTPEYLHTS